jgi:hypothetical protein
MGVDATHGVVDLLANLLAVDLCVGLELLGATGKLILH